MIQYTASKEVIIRMAIADQTSEGQCYVGVNQV